MAKTKWRFVCRIAPVVVLAAGGRFVLAADDPNTQSGLSASVYNVFDVKYGNPFSGEHRTSSSRMAQATG